MHVRSRGGLVTMAQIVTVEQATRHIFLSGQLARALDGSCVGKGDMRAQMIQVGEHIKAGLQAVGATISSEPDRLMNSDGWLSRSLPPAVLFCGLLALWVFAVWAFPIPAYILPSPRLVADAAFSSEIAWSAHI